MRRWLPTLAAMSVLGCKPAEEPARRPVFDGLGGAIATSDLGRPTGTVRVTERIDEPAPAPPVIAAVAPPTITPADAGATVSDAPGPEVPEADSAAPRAATPDAANLVDAGPADASALWPAGAAAELPADLLAALARPVPQALREEAREQNKAGLQAHRKLELEVAKAAYVAALDAHPAYPFARYNLACALALQKRDDEALFHLAVLAHLAREGDKVSRERLDAARVDADFELLREAPRFRALTGATAVTVGWVTSSDADAAKREARRLVQALREARWPARLASAPWPDAGSARIIRVRGGDPIAESAARAVADVLLEASEEASARAWPIEIGAPLPLAGPPIAVVVAFGDAALGAGAVAGAETETETETEAAAETEAGAEAGAETGAETRAETEAGTEAAREPGAAPLDSLADAVGRRLRAERITRQGVEHHRLELKPTGFFTWEATRPTGGRIRRNGRWSANATHLTLSFKETSEIPSPDAPGSPPVVEVKDGVSADLPFAVRDRQLLLDGLAFR